LITISVFELPTTRISFILIYKFDDDEVILKNQFMKILSYSIFIVLLISSGCGKKGNGLPKVSSGTLVRIEGFKSNYISPRNIDVWLPEGYDQSEKYAVLYMNDGQMLFDSTVTWNKQEWQVDEVVSSLIRSERIKKCIVVGVFNNPELRMAEYFPQIALGGLLEPTQGSIVKTMLAGKPLSDDYLRFLVKELKPHIDSRWSTVTGPEGTFIMGSSMGGLISLYALCSYPDVFGGAGCMSTHWPMAGPGLLYNPGIINNMAVAFREYVAGRIPDLNGRRIYFDHGTGTLDSIYKPYQEKVDLMMTLEGFPSENWKSEEFVGHKHDERSWAKRLNIPVEFLLGK
jgi:hypothetical protein